MKKNIFFVGAVIFQLMSGYAYAYNSEDLKKAKSYCINLIGANLIGAYLEDICLEEVHLEGALLTGACLKRANLFFADLSHADLSHADLSHSFLVRIKLHETKVDGTNFYGTIGLTNAKKKYLREHGAINVPEDRSDEEKEMEIVFKAGPWITGPLNISKKILSFIFLTIPKHLHKTAISLLSKREEVIE